MSVKKNNTLNKLFLKGYTLIEVMAALFIFVIVVSIISFSFMQLLNNVQHIRNHEERLTDIQIMLSTLQFDFSQVIEKLELKTPIPRGSFYTDGNTLHFFKTGNINPGNQNNRSSIEEVQYYVENHNLIKLLREDNQTNYKKQVLMEGVQKLEWHFYDSKFGQYTLWPPTQDWQYRAPSAIKLVIDLDGFGQFEKMIEMRNHE